MLEIANGRGRGTERRCRGRMRHATARWAPTWHNLQLPAIWRCRKRLCRGGRNYASGAQSQRPRPW